MPQYPDSWKYTAKGWVRPKSIPTEETPDEPKPAKKPRVRKGKGTREI